MNKGQTASSQGRRVAIPDWAFLRVFTELALSSVLLAACLPGASLSSSSQASCFNLSPVSMESTSQPGAASNASCSETFNFSSSTASASGTASFGSLTAAGSAGDKDITTSFQTTESFSDAIHLYGPVPSGGVNVQFSLQTQGTLGEYYLVGQSPTFALSFSAGGTQLLSESQVCSVACIFTYQYSFSQGYLATAADSGLSPLSFSAMLGLSAVAEAGTGSGFDDSVQLASITLLDPQTGLPISGLSYSTDSGTEYDANASFTASPEPSCLFLFPIGIAVLAIARYLRAGVAAADTKT